MMTVKLVSVKPLRLFKFLKFDTSFSSSPLLLSFLFSPFFEKKKVTLVTYSNWNHIRCALIWNLYCLLGVSLIPWFLK